MMKPHKIQKIRLKNPEPYYPQMEHNVEMEI